MVCLSWHVTRVAYFLLPSFMAFLLLSPLATTSLTATTLQPIDMIILVDNAIAGLNVQKMQEAVDILRNLVSGNPTDIRLGLVAYDKSDRVDNQGQTLIEAQVIIPLTSTQGFNDQYEAESNRIWQVFSESRLDEGLGQGISELLRTSQDGARRIIVALTEGRVVGKNERSSLERLVKTSVSEDIQWYFVLFPFFSNSRRNPAADFLKNLAEHTDGKLLHLSPVANFSEEDARDILEISKPNGDMLQCISTPQDSLTINCVVNNADKYTRFEWNFGDRSEKTTTEPSTSYKYSTGGTYIIRMRATGPNVPRLDAEFKIEVPTTTKSVTVKRNITVFPNGRLLPGLTVEVTVELTLNDELWSLTLEEVFPGEWEDLQIKEPASQQRPQQLILLRTEGSKIIMIWRALDAQPLARETVKRLTYTVQIPDDSPSGRYVFEGHVSYFLANGNQTSDPISLKSEVKVEPGLSIKEAIAFLMLEPPPGATVSPCQPTARSIRNCKLDLYDYDLLIDSEEMRFAEYLWQQQLDVPFTEGQDVRRISNNEITELLCYHQRKVPVTEPSCN